MGCSFLKALVLARQVMSSAAIVAASSDIRIPNPNAFIDWLKPRRSVAIARLKYNGFAMVVTLLVAQLAPIVPTPTTCLWMVATGGSGMSYGIRWLCWIGELPSFASLALRHLIPQLDRTSSLHHFVHEYPPILYLGAIPTYSVRAPRYAGKASSAS